MVADTLKMPKALAGFSVQCDQAIREEIVAKAVGAVKIEGGGTGGDKNDAAFGVERHAGPVVGCAAGFPGVGRPSFVTKLAGMGDGVEGPAKFSGANVESANIAGRGGEGFGIAAADDEQVFVDDP